MFFFTRKVDDHSERVNLILTCLLLAIVAATFFSRIWDPDFFWHLATGRWIVENMVLPERDPFTPFFYGTAREALILKGYWLAQGCYQFFYSTFGTLGLAILKSATFVAIFGMTLKFHHDKKIPYHWVFLALLPLYETLLHFRADRPNMFSLLFFAGLLYLLETRRWKWLPLLMLVWSNAHGGYLLGDVVIALYISVLTLSQRQEVSPQVVGWGLLAVATSFINPLGITPLILMLKFQGSTYQQAVFEFMSPLRIAFEFHDYYLGYFLALILSIGTLFLCRKSALWPQLALLLLTAGISLQHARYMPFFVIACAFLLPRIYSDFHLSNLWGRSLLSVSVALIVILFVSDVVDGRALTSGFEPDRFPEKATEFIVKSGGKGRIFCNDVWGGYLMWRLPEATILSDGRALSEEVHLNNLEIYNTKPAWENELLARDTTIIVVSAFDPIAGYTNNLWKALVYSPNWQLVYADDVALVYFRNDISYAGEQINQQEKLTISLNHALSLGRGLVIKHPQTPRHWSDLGHIHVLRREFFEAVKAYRQALELDPGNDDYLSKVKILEARQ